MSFSAYLKEKHIQSSVNYSYAQQQHKLFKIKVLKKLTGS